MTRARTILAAIGLALRVAAPAAAQTSPITPSSCEGCHGKEAAEAASSAHARPVTCRDCHGGNEGAHAETEAHGGDFKGAIPRSAVPELCAGCHSDVRRMLPSGLKTDQFQHYAVSRHGVAVLEKGNDKAAVCTDCHGVHALLKSSDPASSTAPARLPATCGRCHADKTLMEGSKLKADVVAEFEAGIHGALLKAGLPGVPSCATCHGVHAATPPGAANVASVCGRCHEAEQRAFSSSPHAESSRTEGKVSCVSCHASHATVAQTTERLAQACGGCHEPPTKAAEAGQALQSGIAGVEDLGRRVLDLLARAREDLSVEPHARALEAEVIPGIRRAKAGTHSIDVGFIAKFRERLEVVETEARELALARWRRLADRRILLVPIVIVLGGIAASLVVVRGFVAARRTRAASRSGAAP